MNFSLLILNSLLLLSVLSAGNTFLLSKPEKGTHESFLMQTTSTENSPLVEFIIDRNNKESIVAEREIRKTLSYAKMPYRSMEPDSRGQLSPSSTTRVVVILNVDFLSEPAMENLIRFISNGGTLLLLNNGESKKFGFLSGALPLESYSYNLEARGHLFTKNLFLNKQGYIYDDQQQFGLDGKNFPESVNVWATAQNDSSYPAILQNDLGNGQVLVLNTGKPAQKGFRGLYFSLILNGLPEISWPVVNAASIFLTNFAGPMYEASIEPVNTEYGLSQVDFYVNKWWPDMDQLAKELDLTYTAAVSFDYQNKISPPFNFPEWEQSPKRSLNNRMVNSSEWLIQQLKEQNHEFALSGYNSLPLTDENWHNSQFMGLSLNAALKKWNDVNPASQFKTYIPPSNQIDKKGFAILTQSLPKINIFSSSYFGDFNKGSNREFEPDPWDSRLFDFPIATQGYSANKKTIFEIQSLLLYTGVWTHSLQPQHIFNEDLFKKSIASPQNHPNPYWRKSINGSQGLYDSFRNTLYQVRENFPYLQFVSAQEAVQKIRDLNNATYLHQERNGFYQVKKENTKAKDHFWFAYVPDSTSLEISKYLEKKSISYHQSPLLEGYLYQLKTKNPSINLPYHHKKTSRHLSEKDFSNILKKYKEYLSGKMTFKNPYEALDFNIKRGAVDRLVPLLTEIVQKDSVFKPKDWEDLYKYLSWENKINDFWALLHENYRSRPSRKHTFLAREIASKDGYPDLKIQEYWVAQHIKWNPDNLDLKAEYLSRFGNFDALSVHEAKQLLEKNLKDELKTSLILKVLEENPEGRLLFLDSIQPCQDSYYIPLAARIAYDYSNSEKYRKAIAWAECTSEVIPEDLRKWRFAIGDYDTSNKDEFPFYIEYLLQNQPQKALDELKEVEPQLIKGTQTNNKSIAYLFAEKGMLREALNWSAFDPDFPIRDQLQWLFDLKDYKEMDTWYARYKHNHPDDEETDLAMANFLFHQGETLSSWEIVNSTRENPKRQKLIEELSKHLFYQDIKTKETVYDKYSDLLSPKIKSDLKQELIYKLHDMVSASSSLLSDKLSPVMLKNDLTYQHKDKKSNTHTFYLNHYKGFELSLDDSYPANQSMQLFGIGYGFKNPEKPKFLIYSGSIHLERQTSNDYFFRFLGNVHYSGKKLFSSLSLFHQPVNNAPGHWLTIYKSRLSLYEELRINDSWRFVILSEGSYYNDGGQTGQVSLQLHRRWKTGTHGEITPFIEASGMLGNRDTHQGYPYWIIEKRLYGGTGISYSYATPSKHQLLNLQASFFSDSYSRYFQRYSAQFRQPLGTNFELAGQAEFYTVKNFYHNTFSFQLSYYLP